MNTFSYLSLVTAQHQKDTDFFYSEMSIQKVMEVCFLVVTKNIGVELKCRTWKDSVNPNDALKK